MRALVIVLCLFTGCVGCDSCVEEVSPVEFSTSYTCRIDLSC